MYEEDKNVKISKRKAATVHRKSEKMSDESCTGVEVKMNNKCTIKMV